MKKTLIFIFLSLTFTSQVHALEILAAGSYRNFPQGNTVEISAKEEFILWDQREGGSIWKFGFIQPHALVGAHGIFEAGINLVPVGPLEIGYSESLTSRWYKSKIFDCDQVVCGGIVKRQTWKVRLGLAFGDFFAIPSYSMTKTRHEDKSKPLTDEVEYMNTLPGGEDFRALSVMTGLKLDKDTYGVYARQAEFIDSEVKSEAQYLFYRKEFEPYKAAVGLGRYDSSFSKPGFSIYVNLDWTWGKSQALF